MSKTSTSRAIILDNNEQVLLGKRVRGKFKGRWGLIGGKIERGESPEECIIREVKEEIGSQFNLSELWKDMAIKKPVKGFWHLYFFTGTILGPVKLDNSEVSSVKYFDRKDLDKIDLAFNHKDILEEFFSQ